MTLAHTTVELAGADITHLVRDIGYEYVDGRPVIVHLALYLDSESFVVRETPPPTFDDS